MYNHVHKTWWGNLQRSESIQDIQSSKGRFVELSNCGHGRPSKCSNQQHAVSYNPPKDRSWQTPTNTVIISYKLSFLKLLWGFPWIMWHGDFWWWSLAPNHVAGLVGWWCPLEEPTGYLNLIHGHGSVGHPWKSKKLRRFRHFSPYMRSSVLS